MKRFSYFPAFIFLVILVFSSCRQSSPGKVVPSGDTAHSDSSGMVLIGKEIITDVIIRPDSAGDPWEFEKIKGFESNTMFKTLLDNIYSKKITAYSALLSQPLTPDDVRKIMEEFSSDISRIGKIQFCEDWYLDPLTGNIEKKTKSVIFGYEVKRENGLPPSYKAMYMIKP